MSCSLIRTLSALIVLLGVGLFSACKSKQAFSQAEAPMSAEAERPAWVNSRPITSTDYIGIGLCPKSRPDYQEAAKKNALNDLASEISVKVESNSLLYTLDRKDAFEEEFTSSINTSTDQQIQGYELVDSYETATTYWIYYRLSKSEHARITAERKQQAIDQSTDLFARARKSLATGDLSNAFDQDLRALIAMKEYWGESDRVMVDGKEVPLANEVFGHLQTMTSGVRIAVLPERCVLDHANRFSREMLITATLGDHGQSLVQLPLTITWPAQSGTVTENRSTDAEGRMRSTVQHVDMDIASPVLNVRLNAEALVSKDLDPSFTKPLIHSLTIPERIVPIVREMPKVFINSSERNLGEPLSEAGLALALKEELTAKGFRFTERSTDADMEMTLRADTRKVGEAQGFFTAALDASLRVSDRRTGEVIYEGGRQGVKGIQLDYTKAGIDGYKKAIQELRKDWFPAMMRSILQ